MTPLLLWLATPAVAHDAVTDPTAPALHVGYDYANCYLDLHPELTRVDFRRFTRQFADAGAFGPLSGAPTLGAGHVAVGITFQKLFVDDHAPQWNHTFSHPGEDHWLGQPGVPMLQARVGVHDRVDVEALVTGDPGANWGLAGWGARVAVLDDTAPIAVSARLTGVHLLGAAELDHHNLTLEALASRRFGAVTPYAGLGTTGAISVERTDELDLRPPITMGLRGLVGAELGLGPVRAAVQGTLASTPTVSIHLGAAL